MLDNIRHILLVDELRTLAARPVWDQTAKAMREAAAVIEKLSAEKERQLANILNDAITSDLAETYGGSELERADELEADNKRLVEENERLRGELTAAVCDLSAAQDCANCWHKGRCGRGGCIGYKWRGVKEV